MGIMYITADHGRSRQITADHGRSRHIMAYHDKSQKITAYYDRSGQITADQGRLRQITADHGRLRQIRAYHGSHGRSPLPRHNGVACVQGPLQQLSIPSLNICNIQQVRTAKNTVIFRSMNYSTQ